MRRAFATSIRGGFSSLGLAIGRGLLCAATGLSGVACNLTAEELDPGAPSKGAPTIPPGAQIAEPDGNLAEGPEGAPAGRDAGAGHGADTPDAGSPPPDTGEAPEGEEGPEDSEGAGVEGPEGGAEPPPGSGEPDAGFVEGDPIESENPPRDSYFTWEKIELPGTVCGNNSQYKFFVSYSRFSDNLMVMLEPGGACWDYESCSGQAGILGAANPNGIPDTHMTVWSMVSPLTHRRSYKNPVTDWNMVFIPYCTGDVHTGNNVMTYKDPKAVQPDLEYHHAGHANMMAVVKWLNEQFPKVPRLLVTGCSAGGAGSQVNYYYLRTGLEGVGKGYMLNDSGPVFPSQGYSNQLHNKIRESWNIDPLLDELPEAAAIKDNFGHMNELLANQFPNDRMAITYFRRDFNYSRYSYERFYNNPDKEEILRMWWEDTQLLMKQYGLFPNLGYYIPYFRPVNSSHCAIIFDFKGDEIQEKNMTLEKYIDNLLDDNAPLESYVESVQPGEDQ